MKRETFLDKGILQRYQAVDEEVINKNLNRELQSLHKKIIVLDDDPTGVQTVQNISVYTDWSVESLRDGFNEQSRIFFILTNSRSFTAEETVLVHQEIAKNILTVSRETAIDFILISRGDSTLRGHYPLETAVLRKVLEKGNGEKIDGEVIIPFFKEGGRFTIDNIHYVLEGDKLVPAGETEFAKDKTFPYHSSHLGEWCEEKTMGEFKKDNLIYISLDTLRALDYDSINQSLASVRGFNKVVVNAIDYADIKVFVTALIRAVNCGKRYLLRSAASVTKVIGGVPDRPFLSRDDLILETNQNGGIIVVGSHVNKTSQQLAELMQYEKNIMFIEFDQRLVVDSKQIELEIKRVVDLTEQNIKNGITVAIYTRRERFDLNTGDKEAELKIATGISDAITKVVARLTVKPSFIIAKGGITSSDIGTKAMAVKKATVMGQIKPGIPVWMTGAESKFPGLPYIIFPGNVGSKTTLREVVEILTGK